MARRLVQGARRRCHRPGVLRNRVAADARDAVGGVRMRRFIAGLVSHRMRALVRKELNQIKRDRRITMSLILPTILQLMLFGTVMNPSVGDLKLGVVDDSQSP